MNSSLIGRGWNQGLRHCVLALILIVVIVLIGTTQKSHSQPPINHPLAPLTANEITTAVTVIRQNRTLTDAAIFPQISLQEPEKQKVLNFNSGDPVQRSVLAIVYEREKNQTFEAVVDVVSSQLKSWEEIPDVQPALTDPEYELAGELVKADPRWQAAMAKRGLSNFEDLEISGWAPGLLTETERESGHRILRALTYLKGERYHYYGRPVEGVIAIVNLNEGKVEDVTDSGVVAISQENWDYDVDSLGSLRTAPQPLRITQPAGPSFQLDGNQVSWQGWNFRYVMHPRDGLILYQITYDDGEQIRPMIYRASLSEMAVPYSDPDPNWSFRNAFDVGEYNFGVLANVMEFGKDIPENGVLLDATFADASGEPYTMHGVIGLYERDRGILWKHYDYVTDHTYVRRDRELVVAVTGAIDNYDYGINWIFHQDGSIEVETDLTGIILIQASDAKSVEDDVTPYGALVAQNMIGITHQHFMNFRLDLDVDGLANSVMQMDLKQLPLSETNPVGNA